MSLRSDALAAIGRVAGRDLAHALGVYTYLRHVANGAEEKVASYVVGYKRDDSLSAAFGEEVARGVWKEVRDLGKYLGGRLLQVDLEALSDHVYATYVAPRIKEEAQRRLAGASEDDRRVLAAASAVLLAALAGRRLGSGINIKVSRDGRGAIRAEVVGKETSDHLSEAVSILLESSVDKVVDLFARYLLGIKVKQEWGYVLETFPDTAPIVESLAAELPRFVAVPDRSALERLTRELLAERDKLRASVLKELLPGTRQGSPKNSLFLTYFYALMLSNLVQWRKANEDMRLSWSRFDVCWAANVKGVVKNCSVNPLAYEDLAQVFVAHYGAELERFRSKVLEALKALGPGRAACEGHACVIEKAGDRPVVVYVDPLVSYPVVGRAPENAVYVAVEGALPKDHWVLLSYLREDSFVSKFLWAFLDEETNTIYVLGPTYRHRDHSNVLRALAASFKVEFLGEAPEEALSALSQPVVIELGGGGQAPPPQVPPQAQQAPTAPTYAACSPEGLKARRGRDLLEDVVAAVLEDLGFRVQVDAKLRGKDGGDVEVDVWASKNITNASTYLVYASCKNLSGPMGSDVVENEIGRVERLAVAPHTKVLVVSYISDAARQAAARSGFLVVEVGEKVAEDNAARACERVREQLGRAFAGPPPAPQHLAARVYGLAEELRRLADELSRLQ